MLLAAVNDSPLPPAPRSTCQQRKQLCERACVLLGLLLLLLHQQLLLVRRRRRVVIECELELFDILGQFREGAIEVRLVGELKVGGGRWQRECHAHKNREQNQRSYTQKVRAKPKRNIDMEGVWE